MTFEELFEKQIKNQEAMFDNGSYNDFAKFENLVDYRKNHISLPFDDTKLSSYHIQQLVSEIGEVLESDKRWKNMRNSKYNREDKKLEIADCFIVLMNVAIFSGIDGEEMVNAINEKIDIVSNRIKDQEK